MDRLILPAINGTMVLTFNEWCNVHVFISNQEKIVGFEGKKYLFNKLLNKLKKNETPIILFNHTPYRYVCALSDPYTAIYFSIDNLSLLFIPDNSNIIFDKPTEGIRSASIDKPIILYLSEKNYNKWIKKLSLHSMLTHFSYCNKKKHRKY